MNKYARDMLSRRMNDGRNPYGARGGYVDSRNDGWYDDIRKYPDMYEQYYPNSDIDNASRGGRDRNYQDSRVYQDMRSDRNYEQDSRYDRNSGDMGSRRSGYFDYETRDGDGMKLTSKDMRKWSKKLQNADGTRGAKFEPEQVKQIAQNMGIKMEEYSPETLTMATNMLYSDYSKVLGNDMALYVKMARAFLEDDDFEGSPDEKLMLYYKCIVEKDD